MTPCVQVLNTVTQTPAETLGKKPWRLGDIAVELDRKPTMYHPHLRLPQLADEQVESKTHRDLFLSPCSYTAI